MLLAQALLQKPDLLILDEPFEGLDQTICARLDRDVKRTEKKNVQSF